MWSYEYSLETEATKEQIWTVYKDVKNWPKWDHEIEYAEHQGEFKTGSICILKPKKGPKVKSVMTHCEELKSFTDESKLPLGKLRFHHKIDEQGEKIRITHRIEITGPLTFIFACVIGRKIADSLPQTMKNLVEYARKY